MRSAATLAKTLADEMDLALLFRRIATVELDVPVGAVDDWRWTGPTDALRRRVPAHRRPQPRRVERRGDPLNRQAA